MKRFSLILIVIGFNLNLLAQQLDWVNNNVSNSFMDGGSSVEDNDSNIVTCGVFDLSADFGNGISVSEYDFNHINFYITKFNKNGIAQWCHFIPAHWHFHDSGIATDSLNNIYIVAGFKDTLFLPNQNIISYGNTDFFIAKFDPNGNLIWFKHEGGSEDFAGVFDLHIYGQRLFIGSDFKGTVNFSGNNFTSTGSMDFFVAEYDLDGNFQTMLHGGNSNCAFNQFKIIDESIYILCRYSGSAVLGGTTITSQNSDHDFFLVKYNDIHGNFAWVKNITSPSSSSFSYYNKFTIFEDKIILAGSCYNQVFIDNDPIDNMGYESFFLVKMDTSGMIQNLRIIGQAELPDQSIYFFPMDVSVNSLGNIYFTGTFGDTCQFDDTTFNIINWDAQDLFIAKYDSQLDKKWIERFNDINDCNVFNMFCTNDNALFMHGGYGVNLNLFDTVLEGSNSGFDLKIIDEDFIPDTTSNIVGITSQASCLHLYPNPAQNKLYFKSHDSGIAKIYSLSGQVLLVTHVLPGKNQIDISSLPPGNYFIKIVGNKMSWVGKFVVLR